MELDAVNQSLVIRGYAANQLEQASLKYQAVERAVAQQDGVEAVLVSVESIAALRRAYPNYFLDTSNFRAAVQQATK